MTAPVAAVDGLRVELTGQRGVVVDGVSFEVRAGEVLGLVGESGSGKTTTANALLGYVRRGARIVGGSVTIEGEDILRLPEKRLRRLRGAAIGYVPQDPATALNPALRIGRQLEEALEVHGVREGAFERIRTALEEVALPSDRAFLRRYPHQLSGGQQQRVSLALAGVLRPRLIVLDEPTTGLDVTTQAHVLQIMGELCRVHRVAALYVTHDLAVVSNLADRVMVMYAGQVSEIGSRETMFARPVHPYTATLVRSTPDIGHARRLKGLPGATPPIGRRPAGCAFAGRCPVAMPVCSETPPPEVEVVEGHIARCHRADRPLVLADDDAVDLGDAVASGEAVLTVSSVSARYGGHLVVDDVSLQVGRNECVALVGESGSGKTTLARAIVGLHKQRAGEILLHGRPLERDARSRSIDAQRVLQYVFQSPYNSLNPRKTVGQIIDTSLRRFFDHRGAQARQLVADCLEQVSLPVTSLGKFPYQLSGGERQRVAIARALICQPEILVCDEITSALDVSVQASIVELLRGLQESRGLSMLFITHNLALVRSIAHRVVVMRSGRVVEAGATEQVLSAPASSYARALVDDTPAIVGARSMQANG